jgi:hypothetical protein
LTRGHHLASEREWDMIEEALRRLTERERMVRHVLPELRNQLTTGSSGTAP